MSGSTMEEKDKSMRQAEAYVAIGGGTMTPAMRKDVEDMIDGRRTPDEVRADLMKEYGVTK